MRWWAERTAHCTPTRVRTHAHLEACLAAVLGLAALAALPAGAHRAAVAAQLAVSVTLAAAFLGCLAALFLGRLAAARGGAGTSGGSGVVRVRVLKLARVVLTGGSGGERGVLRGGGGGGRGNGDGSRSWAGGLLLGSVIFSAPTRLLLLLLLLPTLALLRLVHRALRPPNSNRCRRARDRPFAFEHVRD